MRRFSDITVLVDRSGSMSSIKTAMESGFDEFLTEHRKTPSTRLTLVQFDEPALSNRFYKRANIIHVDYEALPIAEAGKLVLNPRGNTPLYDAVCQTIDRTGTRLANVPAADRPDQVLFVIITDGQENSSQQYRVADVRQRIEHQQGAYNWHFTFLGANQDAFKEAVDMGIPIAATLNYSATGQHTNSAWRGMTKSSANLVGRATSDICYASEVRSSTLTADEQHKAVVPTETK